MAVGVVVVPFVVPVVTVVDDDDEMVVSVVVATTMTMIDHFWWWWWLPVGSTVPHEHVRSTCGALDPSSTTVSLGYVPVD